MSHKSDQAPFYVHPMGKKRSVQIIKEAKAEIKKMESNRPITPIKERKKSNYMVVEHQDFSRPLSSTSIRSLIYEYEENNATHNQLISTSAERESKFSDGALKLQPIIVKPLPLHKRSSNTTSKLLKEALFTGFPPIDNLEIASTTISNDFEKLKNTDDFINKEDTYMNDNAFTSEAIEDLSSLALQQSKEIKIVDECNDEEKETVGLTISYGLESKELSKSVSAYFPILEQNAKLGKYRSEEDIINAILSIHDLLSERKAFLVDYDNRIPLLKLLFKFLNTNYPVLTLHVVRLLLDMKMAGRNLANVFKIILKFVKDKNVNQNEYIDFDSFFERMIAISVESNYQASLLGLQIMNHLFLGDKSMSQKLNMISHVLFHHLEKLSLLLSTKNILDRRYNEFIILVMSMLRSISEEENILGSLLSVRRINNVLLVLKCTHENIDVVDVIVRLISKIVDDDSGCEALSQCSRELLLSFLTILETHRYNIDITLQVTFLIGNLVSANDHTAVTFVSAPNFINTILVLGEYINEHLQFRESLSDCFKRNNQSSGDRNWQIEIFDVIIKILCIWANICLYPEAGHHLVSRQSILTHLLGVVDVFVDSYERADSSMGLHPFLVVINNISYYLGTETELCLKAAESIIPILDEEFSLNVRLEAVNIVRNLTRSTNVRLYVQEHSLFPAMIKLVSVEDKEFSIGAYGLIMNLLVDKNARQTFYIEDGVTRVLHKLNLCADRDWKTCAVLCQILLNYCGGENADSINISKIEAEHLIKFLSYSTNKDKESEDSNCFKEWADEYCPVALKLLKILKGNNL